MAKYKLTISRNTIDKLGVKLYDRASDVISELVSNSYDADAEKVEISVPLGEYLATKKGQEIKSKDLKITVKDDGHGFSEDGANDFYLKVGTDRRVDEKRGARSLELRRPVMGRKGIGKLSAFGICKTIEVWSATGKKGDESYKISNFVMNYDDMVKDTDVPYHPMPGKDDGKRSNERGTRITLSDFLHKKIPDKDTFMRQIARKFGIGSEDFKILVTDITTGQSESVSGLHIDLMEGTKIPIDERSIQYEGGSLPVNGWVAYSKHSYRNEEMAGVRIYARGKLATATRDFGRKSGFTGEFTIRTYLVGEIDADWLDADDGEDLIASDRQDILWSSEKGQALQEWGQKLIEKLGKNSLKPMRKKSFETFKEKSKLEHRAKQRFGDGPVYDAAIKVGKTLAGSFSIQSLTDDAHVKNLLELVLAIAPHKMIVDKLKEISDEGNQNALEVMSAIFGDAKLAETASLGQIAMERIRAIGSLEKAVKGSEMKESEMQRILESAPWLIDPQWTVLQSNQSFKSFYDAFMRQRGEHGGSTAQVSATPQGGTKRPDFILLHVGKSIEIVEIKKPGHVFNNDDFDRLLNYVDEMENFRNKHKSLSSPLPKHHFTLIRDSENLNKSPKKACKSLKDEGMLEAKTWEELLANTKHVHEDFLKSRDELLKESSSGEDRRR